MAKSFALRRWSDFERLAFELTKNSFGIVPTRLLRTQESKDGGFDAVFVHELGKLNETVIGHETLMEAKLRSGKSAVGLRAFAATMIIAFNGSTHCLVVVTNRGFSPQALTAARDFQWKSRLQMILVDQRTLSAWIRPRLKSLAKRYPRELLSDILLDDPADEKYEEVEIQEGPVAGTEPRARVSFGRLPDGHLAKGEIVPVAERLTSAQQVVVIGAARRQIARDLLTALSSQTGCVSVQGESGSGKSHVVRSVLASLPPERRCLGLVDMTRTLTARQVFLAVLAQLLGIEVSDAARQFTKFDSEQVFATTRGIFIPEDVRVAVIAVLTSDSRTTSDVDQAQLVHYLSLIAQAARTYGRLIVFHNLDKTTGEALEFLQAVLAAFVANNVSVILEVTIGTEAPLLGLQAWNAYVRLFESSSTLGCFRVPNLSLEDGVQLLLEQLPGLGADRAHVICQRVGTRPLFLHHAALWLKRQQIVLERAHGVHLVEDPVVFFEGVRPEVCISILDRHIDLWRRELTFPYADAITAASLLNGHLPNAAVELLTPTGMRVETMLDALVETGLFAPERQLLGVQVSHSLLLERMIAIEEGRVPGYSARKFDRKRVANKLLAGIGNYTSSPAIQDFYRSALFVAGEEWQNAWENAHRAGVALLCENQLLLAAEAFARGVNVAEAMVGEGDSRGSIWRIHSLVDLLQVENARYRLGLKENLLRLEALNVGLSTTFLSNETRVESEFRLRTLYLNWRAAFTRERFDEALPIARDLFRHAMQTPDVDEHVAGRAIAALGITLKALEQPEQSKQIFDQGLARFPNSTYFQTERWSNLAALALRSNPVEAVSYYRRILDEIRNDTSVSERAYVETDLSMALFLEGRLREAMIQAQLAVTLADANGIPAQGARGRNILGCIHWSEDRVADAINLFDRAILDAERSYMERFLWRFRINLAVAAAEIGRTESALANARWAEDRLVRARASHWSEIAATPAHITSRWYVGLLAVAQTYHRCAAKDDMTRLTQAVALPRFVQHTHELVQGHFPSEVFEGTTHRHGNRIMITG